MPDNKDPWGRKSNENPPDLIEFFQKIFGKKSGNKGGLPKANWLAIIPGVLLLVWGLSGFFVVQEQDKAKEEERRAAEERNKLKRKKDPDEMEGNAKHDSDDEIVLGVGEFFLAQKAAKMMLHWLDVESEE